MRKFACSNGLSDSNETHGVGQQRGGGDLQGSNGLSDSNETHATQESHNSVVVPSPP
ncbi:hypothetical protein [Rhodanobacter denitrificans]|uniref:hypothetical protein n=1 Tax=Rhodanobacter denitrificans TaxID=666685 RepID=UPI0012FE0A4D|nr:hypothetical protein [Rhodanobacter denitrificans]UJM87235.1 hypothetical protein LRJ86_02670 [Rhodanobacter denitrificans]